MNSVTVRVLVRAFWCPHVPFLSVSAGSRVLGPLTLSPQLDTAILKPHLLEGGPSLEGGPFIAVQDPACDTQDLVQLLSPSLDFHR